MKNVLRVFSYLMLAVLVGCAANPVKVNSKFWNKKGQKIDLAMTELPKPTAHKAGAQGLLDIAINNAVAGTLERHLATVDISGANSVIEALEEELRKRGQIPIRLKTIKADQLADFKAPKGKSQYAKKDLRKLSEDEPVDAVLLVSVTAVGTIRNYYGFVPTSAPAGYIHVENSMVSSKDNKLIWSAQVSLTKPVKGEWDQPPKYANINKAINAAVTLLPDSISKELFASP